eukprot:3979127-Ditylum_brightwellii.AAC.1
MGTIKDAMDDMVDFRKLMLPSASAISASRQTGVLARRELLKTSPTGWKFDSDCAPWAPLNNALVLEYVDQ